MHQILQWKIYSDKMLLPAACHVSNKLPRYSGFLKGESNVLKISDNDETKLSKHESLKRELSNTTRWWLHLKAGILFALQVVP